ncbi:hypothetical protein HAX54_016274 [Datura stramonium]|uniref:C2H2-type domain-containing protein n=1 Tax=Datura stramonium TaxID=4076 RepID=A0ABS8S002_DATST|nr:hypothetical protein [Datura stramonium]
MDECSSNMRNSFKNYYYYSFAEEYYRRPGSGHVWPPRCYACSFCKREFRSAQALGGHMNVHRRDRARLKQSRRVNEGQTKPSQAGSKPAIFSHLAYSPAIKELAGRKVLSSETMHSKRSNMEDIDLELRLGDPPVLVKY